MQTRIVISLLAAGALAFACGPRAASEAAPKDGTRTAVVRDSDSPLASSLRVNVDDGVALALHVTNATDKKVEIRFKSGQTHDFVVLDSAGYEVWRWSDGRMFTQALQTRLLDGGETLSYEDEWAPTGMHGRYTAVAELHSDSHPVEARVDFVLP